MGILGSIVDSIIDAFKGGPANWRDRLGGEIVLLSPEGNEFKGAWRGNSRSMAKKLGVLKHPKIKGDIVQDMDVASTVHPITFYFAGDNNDTEANAFMQSCKETGTWEITHPVDGFHTLQLVSVQRIDEPIEGGGITEFNTEWIEPIDPLTLKTGREMAGILDAKIDDLNVNAVQQFANNILAESESLRCAIESTTAGIKRVTALILGPLFTTVDALDVAANAIQNGITDTNNATVLQVEALAGQIQNLIELPLFATSSLDRRIAIYAELTTAFLDMLPGGENYPIRDTATDDEKRNSIATTELALTATIAALGKIVNTANITPAGIGPDDMGSLATRPQAVAAADQLADIFNAIIDAMEIAQDEFSTNTVDKQYYCFLESYADAATLIYLAIEYLLNTTLKLSIEKRFTLNRPRAPIEITITEYGKLGVNDVYFDLFIRSNDLHGSEIMLLPAGREVMVYA